MAIKMTVETITPAMATDYLKMNTNNYRKLQRSVVMRYTDDIKNGKWELNGESIVFGNDGQLKDGQHRLAAIILAKKSVKMTVIRGIDDSVTIFNLGSKRTVSQIASSKGVECNGTVAAAAKIIACEFRYNLGSNETLEYIDAHLDELNRAYRIACYGNCKSSKNGSCVAACYLMLRAGLIKSYEAELFFRLFNDKGMTRCDGYDASPALIARKMLDERAKGCSGYQIQKERLEIICLALRDFSLGEARKMPYRIGEPFFYEELIKNIKEMDQEV